VVGQHDVAVTLEQCALMRKLGDKSDIVAGYLRQRFGKQRCPGLYTAQVPIEIDRLRANKDLDR